MDSDTITQCPLCQTPIGSRDELQLHYLTSCSGYDKVSNEQPRSKLSSNRPHSDNAPTALELADSAESRAGRGWQAPGQQGGGGLAGSEQQRLQQQVAVGGSPLEDATPTAAVAPAGSSDQLECSVQFMWQPTTSITYPCVTLLASFQRGSVELDMDPEGGHYQSKFVNIAKGTYEGQLVIGDSFIHPIKEFTISKDDDIIILHFKFSKECCGRDYGLGYNMQPNPSYGSTSSSSSSTFSTRPLTYTNPMFNYSNTGYPYTAQKVNTSSSLSERRRGEEGFADVSTVMALAGRYRNDPTEGSTGTKNYSLSETSSSTSTSAPRISNILLSNTQAETQRLLESNTHPEEPASPPPPPSSHNITAHRTKTSHATANTANTTSNTSNTSSSSSSRSGSNLPPPTEQKRVDDLMRELQEVTQERDTLLQNQNRVGAVFETRIKRLQQQLEGGAGEGMRKELEELKDQNTALQEQLQEYAQTIIEERKIMESSSKEAKQLLDFTKKQQLVHAESFSDMKDKIETAMKLHDDYIGVSQTNISLNAELQDYRKQTRILAEEMRQKDEEIGELKHALAEGSSDRLALELTTMRQKCEGWKEEVDKLMPLTDEVKQLRKENAELVQQMTMLVEEGEQKKALDSDQGRGRGGGSVMDYDTLMERMTELQDMRVTMEEELCGLREERASILQENASLREGSQPQNYANLKAEYENTIGALREVELSLADTKKLNGELQAANLELHQKLVTATDPEKLRNIQERMVRYKNERDVAKVELEAMQAQLIAAEVDAKNSQEALAKYSGKGADQLQHRLDEKEEEVRQLQTEQQKLESHVYRYRDERNKYKERSASLLRQVKHLEEALDPVTPKLEGGASSDVEEEVMKLAEGSSSPSQQFAGSPTLEYAPEVYSSNTTTTSTTSTSRAGSRYSASSSHHRREDCNTPSDGTVSPSGAKQHHSRSSAAATGTTGEAAAFSSAAVYGQPVKPSKGESCMFQTVQVRTKDGVREMDIQRPSTQLNPKYKPQVVVKRDSGFEAATLMFVGTIAMKDLAGVALDLRKSSNSLSDGTYKDGKRYFKCTNGYGLYLPLSRVYVEMESATV